MNKKAFMEKIRAGKQKELTVAGETFLLKAPKLDKYGMIEKLQKQIEQGTETDFSLMAKIVIDNAFSTETGEPYFSAGDFEALKEDRFGAVKELAEGIVSLLYVTEEEKEETKKN